MVGKEPSGIEFGCFTLLPPELRIQIYAMAATSHSTIDMDDYATMRDLLSITKVSREAREEALPCFWKQNRFMLPTHSPSFGREIITFCKVIPAPILPSLPKFVFSTRTMLVEPGKSDLVVCLPQEMKSLHLLVLFLSNQQQNLEDVVEVNYTITRINNGVLEEIKDQYILNLFCAAAKRVIATAQRQQPGYPEFRDLYCKALHETASVVLEYQKVKEIEDRQRQVGSSQQASFERWTSSLSMEKHEMHMRRMRFLD